MFFGSRSSYSCSLMWLGICSCVCTGGGTPSGGPGPVYRPILVLRQQRGKGGGGGEWRIEGTKSRSTNQPTDPPAPHPPRIYLWDEIMVLFAPSPFQIIKQILWLETEKYLPTLCVHCRDEYPVSDVCSSALSSVFFEKDVNTAQGRFSHICCSKNLPAAGKCRIYYSDNVEVYILWRACSFSSHVF